MVPVSELPPRSIDPNVGIWLNSLGNVPLRLQLFKVRLLMLGREVQLKEMSEELVIDNFVTVGGKLTVKLGGAF